MRTATVCSSTNACFIKDFAFVKETAYIVRGNCVFLPKVLWVRKRSRLIDYLIFLTALYINMSQQLFFHLAFVLKSRASNRNNKMFYEFYLTLYHTTTFCNLNRVGTNAYAFTDYVHFMPISNSV